MPNYTRGQPGYHPGLDDPRVLEHRITSSKKPWPNWALPTALIASGLTGHFALRPLLKYGPKAKTTISELLKKQPKDLTIKQSHIITILGKIARQ